MGDAHALAAPSGGLDSTTCLARSLRFANAATADLQLILPP
jgi:7-cyano-7-deazaguanine synthase in queuosine biosynthesis